jgi:hypothetical protein
MRARKGAENALHGFKVRSLAPLLLASMWLRVSVSIKVSNLLCWRFGHSNHSASKMRSVFPVLSIPDCTHKYNKCCPYLV